MLIGTCRHIEGGLPTNVKLKMYVNVIFDFIIGLVPLVGDFADALFRANVRNAILLEEYLHETGSATLRGRSDTRLEFDDRDPDERYWQGASELQGWAAV